LKKTSLNFLRRYHYDRNRAANQADKRPETCCEMKKSRKKRYLVNYIRDEILKAITTIPQLGAARQHGRLPPSRSNKNQRKTKAVVSI